LFVLVLHLTISLCKSAVPYRRQTRKNRWIIAQETCPSQGEFGAPLRVKTEVFASSQWAHGPYK
jgi:hypothetical protein